ncbi:MAG: NTP transferase domain-containing protein [Nocardioidaceae bacterium]
MDGTVAGLAGVVLSGGGGARLGGRDKSVLEYDGRRLLDRVLDALGDCEAVVVAGPPVPTGRPVTFVREDPPSGGPVAGLLAAVRALAPGPARGPELVVVVAVDMPLLTAWTVTRLRAAAAGRDGAVLVDGEGRRHLAACLRLARLEARVGGGTGHGVAWRALLEPLDLAEVPAVEDEGRDVDTWADLPGGAAPPEAPGGGVA